MGVHGTVAGCAVLATAAFIISGYAGMETEPLGRQL